jgi:hypothetical protein
MPFSADCVRARVSVYVSSRTGGDENLDDVLQRERAPNAEVSCGVGSQERVMS